jgi:hypothetical protein
VGAPKQSSPYGLRLFGAPLDPGKAGWARSEIHDRGGPGTDAYGIEPGRCRLEHKSETRTQIPPNIKVRRYGERDGGSDAYQKAAITCSGYALGTADYLADRPAIRASLIALSGSGIRSASGIGGYYAEAGQPE